MLQDSECDGVNHCHAKSRCDFTRQPLTRRIPFRQKPKPSLRTLIIMTKLAVLGAGSWGTALAHVAAQKTTNDVRIWSHNANQVAEINQYHTNAKYLPNATLSDNLVAYADMAEAVAGVDVVLSVVPTKATREVARQLADILAEQAHTVIVAHATKGLEQGTFKHVSEMLAEEIPAHNRAAIVVISGPSHAEDVVKNDITAVSVASDIEAAAQVVQETFAYGYFRPYLNHDLYGSELVAALKNIMAIGSGALTGLGYGDNAKAALLTRGLAEMMRLGEVLGVPGSTFVGLAGIGDLIVTGMSPNSRNYRAGQQLGEGKTLAEVQTEMGMVIEGVGTTKAVHELALAKNVDMPITAAIYRVLYEEQPLVEAITSLMTRDLKAED